MTAGGQKNKYVRVFETQAGKGPGHKLTGGHTHLHTNTHRSREVRMSNHHSTFTHEAVATTRTKKEY